MLVRVLARRTAVAALALASFGSPASALDDTPTAQLATPAINALGLRRWASALLGREDDDTRWVRIGPGETVRRHAARAPSAARDRAPRSAGAGAAASAPPDSAARSRGGSAPGGGSGTFTPGAPDSGAAAGTTAPRRLAPRQAEPLGSRGEPDSHHDPVRLAARVVSPPGSWPVMVELALPLAGDATVELFDLAGRRLLRERLAPSRAETRLFPLEFAPGASGMYWLRLEQAGRAAVADVIVRR